MGWQASEWLVDAALVGAAAVGSVAAPLAAAEGYKAAMDLQRQDPRQLAPTPEERRTILSELRRCAEQEGR